jgi:porin
MTLLVLFLALLSASPAGAQQAPAAGPYSGDLLTRSTLTGDWAGLRNDLAERGVTFDLSLTQIEQGIVRGGKKRTWKYGGHGDLVVNVDSQKLGLWPGGFLNLEAEGNWSSAVNADTGALMPVDFNRVLPLPNRDFYLDALNFTQFFSTRFGVTFGKYATITSTDGDMNEFAHGKGDTQFLNMALNFNPVLALTVPYSTLGAGVVVLPTAKPEEAVAKLLVLQTNGTVSSAGFDDLSRSKLSLVGEGRLTTHFFERTGHQLLGFSLSNKNYTSLDQRLEPVLEGSSLEKQNGSWNVYYNFDQYLYQPEKGSDRGLGVFGRFGVSDGDANPMHFFYSVGVGGKGVIPGRPRDQFGVGFYYLDIERPSITGPFRTMKLLRDEYGFEAYYNAAVTPWLQLTPDIQVVRGAQKNKIDVNAMGPPFIDREAIDTSVVLGLRLRILL